MFTLSFGEARQFYIKNDSNGQKINMILDDGDLIYFSPETDKTHKHCIPKDHS